MDFALGILGTITAAGILAACRAVWKRRISLRGSVRKSLAEFKTKRAHDRARKDRGRLIAQAAEEGRVVPVARFGTHPVGVKWSDGTETYYFGYDMSAYRHAILSGDYPHDRTFHGDPPPLVTKRGADAI